MLQRLFQSAVCNDEPTTISMKTKSQLTRSGVSSVGLVDTLSKDNSEAGFQMPVDVAVEEPGSGVVSGETDGNVVTSGTDVDDITTRGVGVVVGVGASAANDIEDVTVQVKRVTTTDDTTRHAEFDGSVARQ